MESGIHYLHGHSGGDGEEETMAGKIFYRQRRKVDEGDRMPRFGIVAVADVDLKVRVKHLRKGELEQIASEVGAELIELEIDDHGGHKQHKEGDE